MSQTQHPPVSLVLSGGGARGYAHIGAIEVLEERGYPIRSVSGTSMGALIGGIYCAGRLPQAKAWALTLTRRHVLALADWAVSSNYLVKGDKVMERLSDIVPDQPIEDLPIAYRAVASDLTTCREVVFRRGSLCRAIRASISIPSLFRPVQAGCHLLVDGSVANPLPLNRAVRSEGDLLIAVDVNGPLNEAVEQLKQQASERRGRKMPWAERVMAQLLAGHIGGNYVSLLTSVSAMMVMRLSVVSRKVTPPDVCATIPMNHFGLLEFDQADRIIRAGRQAMTQALDEWEATNRTTTGIED